LGQEEALLRLRWLRQRAQAKHRREQYQLTWEEFRDIWIHSTKKGHIGATRGSYSMIRVDHTQPWQLGNVAIVSRGYHHQRKNFKYATGTYMEKHYVKSPGQKVK
jgi:hypothetical protein